MERLYLQSTRAFAVIVAVCGLAMITVTLARGGGPLALGVVVGVLFTLLGAGRFVLAGATRRDA